MDNVYYRDKQNIFTNYPDEIILKSTQQVKFDAISENCSHQNSFSNKCNLTVINS